MSVLYCFASPPMKTAGSLVHLRERMQGRAELLGLVIEGVGGGMPHGSLVASPKALLTLVCKQMDVAVPQHVPLPHLLCRED